MDHSIFELEKLYTKKSWIFKVSHSMLLEFNAFESCFKNFIEMYGGPQELSFEVLVDYFTYLVHDLGYSRNTLNSRLKVFKMFAEVKFTSKQISEIDYFAIKGVPKWENENPHRVFRKPIKTEINKTLVLNLINLPCFSPITYRDRTIISLLVQNGFTPSRIVNLKISDVTIKDQSCIVDGTKLRLVKGGCESIRTYIQECLKPSWPLVCVSKRGGGYLVNRRMTFHGINQVVASAGRRAKIERLTLKDCRLIYKTYFNY